MAISNISGTTMPSFKLKQNGGIELISAAIRDEEGKVIANKFRVKTREYDKDSGSSVDVIHDVAYYDTHIASDDIRCLKYVDQGLKIFLKKPINGQDYIIIDNSIRKDSITFDTEDENYEEGRIVVIGKKLEGGNTVLKGTPYGVVNEYNGNSKLTDIPTVQATKSIAEEAINDASIDLIERVNGDNVTLVNEN